MLQKIMQNRLLICVSTIGAIFLFLLGYGLGSRAAAPGRSNTASSGDISKHEEDRIVTDTKTTKPDGTVVESHKTEKKIASSETTTQVVSSTPEPGPPTNYSLGVKYWGNYTDLLRRPDWTQAEVVLGRRVLGLLWGEVGIRPGTHEFSVGIRTEF